MEFVLIQGMILLGILLLFTIFSKQRKWVNVYTIFAIGFLYFIGTSYSYNFFPSFLEQYTLPIFFIMVFLIILIPIFWRVEARMKNYDYCQVCEKQIKKGDKFCPQHQGKLNSDEEKYSTLHKSLLPLGIIGYFLIWWVQIDIITYIYLIGIFILFIYFQILKKKMK